MSKFKVLAVAVAATLAASSAYAVTVTPTPATPVPQNSNQFTLAATAATITSTLVAATVSDSYLSRTTPYNVRVTLSAGKIASVPTITLAGGAASAVLVAGTGTIGSTEFVVRVTPNVGGTGVGEGFTITTLTVDNLQTTLNNGGSLSLSGSVSDPGTGATLPNSAFSQTVYTAAQGVAVDFIATAAPAVIDVGQPSSKKFFAINSGAAIGSGVTGNEFNAGQIIVKEPAGLATWLQNTGTVQVTVNTTTGDFSAFKNSGPNTGKIFLSALSTCGTNVTGGLATISADNKTATFGDVTLSNLDAGVPFDAYVCFDGNGVTEMTMGDVKATAVVKPGAGFSNFTSGVGTLASLAYNGPVVTVDSFNPASNPYIVSYLRISNTSGTSGRVTIKPTCDNGTSPGTAVISSLAGGTSILVEASHIENGGGAVNLGAGSCATGKTRLQIIGEIGGMAVQNFMRHNTSIGVINNNINNEK